MKILLVDDQSYNRDLLRFIMEDEQHECLDAADGKQAIDMFKAHEDIDIILMDVNMPVMGGIEATKQITQLKANRHVVIIFVTAMDNSDILTQCLNAGGDDFIPKPINEPILLAKVSAHSRSIHNHKQLVEANRQLDLHNSQIKREHDIVENVFENLQSLSPTIINNITSYSSPMSIFNGDAMLSCASPSGGLYFLIGDFTGHGLSAAIGSLPVVSIFYNHAKRQSSVSEIANEINNQLNKILPLGLFFCAAIGHLDPNGDKLILWSGGMNDALLRDSSTGKITEIVGEHMPLGIQTPSEFDDTVQIHTLNKGSKIYFYTDGINEAQDEHLEMFGDQRVKDILYSYDYNLPQNVIFHIVNEVKAFTEGSQQEDDITILEIDCSPCVHRDRNSHEIIDVAKRFHSVECFQWKLSLTLLPEDMQSTDTVHQVISFLGTIPGVELHQDKIFTIFSELYNNSLEHGVLGLSSSMKDTPDGFEQYYSLRQERLNQLTDARIDIHLEYIKDETNYVLISITDSGEGFNFEKALEKTHGDDHVHGRGIGLVKLLCDSLEFSHKGKTVVAKYLFTN